MVKMIAKEHWDNPITRVCFLLRLSAFLEGALYAT